MTMTKRQITLFLGLPLWSFSLVMGYLYGHNLEANYQLQLTNQQLTEKINRSQAVNTWIQEQLLDLTSTNYRLSYQVYCHRQTQAELEQELTLLAQANLELCLGAAKQAAKSERAVATAAKHYNLDAKYLLAIWQQETQQGQNLGQHRPSQVMSASQYRDFIQVCQQAGLDPKLVPCSRTGDLGPFQFQPKTWLDYGVDGNGDSLADPLSLADSAASCANLLVKLGVHSSPRLAFARYNGGYRYAHLDAAQNYAGSIIRTVNNF